MYENSWHRFLTTYLFLYNLPNPSSRTVTMASIQTPTELNIRNIPEGKGLPARKADKLASIFEPAQEMWEPRRSTSL
jgi:hypothetical protein